MIYVGHLWCYCVYRATLEICARAQGELAKEKAVYEMFLDEHIIAPLQTLVDVSISKTLKIHSSSITDYIYYRNFFRTPLRVLQTPLTNSTWFNHTYLFFPEVILCKNTTFKFQIIWIKFTSSRTICSSHISIPRLTALKKT